MAEEVYLPFQGRLLGRRVAFLPDASDEVYAVGLAFLAHFFRPDAGLDFADMCLAQVEHAEAGLSDASADGEREGVVHQAFVEV